MSEGVYGTAVPDAAAFASQREVWRTSLASDAKLRAQAVQLQLAAEMHSYTYQIDWCGIPVIRLADDIVLLQEMIWKTRPSHIIEAGVARGGGLVLDASLMAMAQLYPKVLGIDIQIFPHAREAIEASPFADCITLFEGDSAGAQAREVAQALIDQTPSGTPGILILDSDHSHEHVLNELRSLGPLMRPGSLIVVADTLIEEFPKGTFVGRPWDVGNNPMTAVRQFLEESHEFELALEWSRRGLVSELRDGVLRRVA